LDVKVVNYGYRSVTAVPFPLDINSAQRETLEAIPYVGKKRAARILLKRPFSNKEQLLKSIDDPEVGQKLLEYMEW
jgi:radical SAM superfamily enzyme with C-terminal helix-hairpin-helix motif